MKKSNGKTIWKRGLSSFAISALCGLIVNLLIEVIVVWVTKDSTFSTLSPEFAALFPSDRIATMVNVLLYGIIGAAFSGASVIYEQERIGYLIQNLLYFLVTALVWVPVVMLVWQLYRYPVALAGTVFGFFITHVIMAILGYRITRQDLKEINHVLSYVNL